MKWWHGPQGQLISPVSQTLSLLPSLNLKILDMLFFYSSWVNAMYEELENFERNQVWTLVEPPRDVNSIGTKWLFKNKQGDDGEVVRNKARLVAQGFSQVKV
jgi:hypothetical protein